MTDENEKIILHQGDSVEKSFATFFFCEKQKLAVSVMKSYRHPDNADHRLKYNETAFNEWMRNIFISDQTACKTVSESVISNYFLAYFPGYEVERITDRQGKDISEYYLTDCALAFELIRAPHFPQHSPVVRTYCIQEGVELDMIFSELKKMGVMNYKDAVVLFNRFGSRKVIIMDISMKDYDSMKPPSL